MRAPQFVVVESPRSTVDRGYWVARPLNLSRPLLDVAFGRATPINPRAIHATIRETDNHTFCVTTQVGAAKGGRRYRYFHTYPEAQACVLAWAQRRFRLSLDG